MEETLENVAYVPWQISNLCPWVGPYSGIWQAGNPENCIKQQYPF